MTKWGTFCVAWASSVLERGGGGFLADLQPQFRAPFGGCERGDDLVADRPSGLEGPRQTGFRVRPIDDGRRAGVLAEPGLGALAGVVDVRHPEREADRAVGGGRPQAVSSFSTSRLNGVWSTRLKGLACERNSAKPSWCLVVMMYRCPASLAKNTSGTDHGSARSPAASARGVNSAS